MKEKTKHHKHNISAGFHPGIDKDHKHNISAGFHPGIDNNSRTSMPVLARPCTPDVETSRHAGHMVDAPHQKKKKKKPVAAMFG